MKPDLTDHILALTGAGGARRIETLQSLWSGYGEIVRYQLTGADHSSIIVKHIKTPQQHEHPRGWNTDIGHRRKLHSYQVETEWYREYAHRCSAPANVPRCLGITEVPGEVILVLEDLDAAGFPRRRETVSGQELRTCLQWLAWFHASFLFVDPGGLWPTGCYWHLETRPEEWERMPEGPLRAAAAQIDQQLNSTQFMTLVHGDAKLENFCFSSRGDGVAAVDFQYVGAGCGMKDLAYFMSSCLNEAECEKQQADILDYYFLQLRDALESKGKHLDTRLLEQEWRRLYCFAWADFYRFLAGWMPGHWKINRYSEHMVQQALRQLAD